MFCFSICFSLCKIHGGPGPNEKRKKTITGNIIWKGISVIYELRLLPNRSGRGHEASIPQHMLMFNDQSPNPCEKYMNIPWKMGSAPAANSKIQAWARARNKSPVAHNKYIERLDEKYMFGHARACRRSCPVLWQLTLVTPGGRGVVRGELPYRPQLLMLSADAGR